MTICLRRCWTVLRTLQKQSQLRNITTNGCVRAVAIPKSDTEPKKYSKKVEDLAENIAQLNLLEVADLSDLLKKKLNLPDAPAMGFAVAAPASAAEASAEDEQEDSKNIQTFFDVKIKAFDEKQKVALIKELKVFNTELNLVQAKKVVESAPVVVKKGLSKEEAEKMKEALSKVGGDIEII